jgi:hypothetical protein
LVLPFSFSNGVGHPQGYRILFCANTEFGRHRSSCFPKPRTGFVRRRLQQREEFLAEVAQGGVVEEQRFVDLGEALEDGGVGGGGFALFDEGADDPSAASGQVPALIFTASARLIRFAEFTEPTRVRTTDPNGRQAVQRSSR